MAKNRKEKTKIFGGRTEREAETKSIEWIRAKPEYISIIKIHAVAELDARMRPGGEFQHRQTEAREAFFVCIDYKINRRKK
jgi:hypothetical protein